MSKESHIEESLIKQLTELKYTYRPDIVDRKSLEQNFKTKFEALNRVRLSDNEFLRLREEIINPDVYSASKLLRERSYFQREDGTPLHYTLVNNKEWCKNDFEVISQLRINTENSHQRYDIILLINGLPVVQIELKKNDISPRKAMQQIVDYKNEAGNGYSNSLLCYMQLFIVSNKTNTYYFANNKNQHFAFNADEQFLPIYQLADESNKKITHLESFTDKFLTKCTLGEMLSKYMVLVESEQKLLIMRPYQIYAVKAIVDCIKENRGNGYIWHTTGSGKTLTSFKASTLLKDNADIEKCLFVVDPLKILEENNYYPFGLKHNSYNVDNFQPEYKYKFQGQERQDELGLNWDSFKWRNYDYAIGRFMSIDPLAEKYSYQSSYNFSENRVIDARELEGLEAFIIHGTTQTKTGHTFSNSALNQLQRIGGNTVRNESFRWNAPLFNNDSFDRALAAKELASYVVNKRASLIKSGKISDSEPITLVGYSHGGNVGIQAADIIYDVTGLKVNLLTVSTPAYKTDKSLVGSGLAGLEDPNKKTSINSHIQVVHKNDDVVNLALGNETYNTNNSAHPVKNYVIPEKEVNLSGGIESHTKLPSNSNFAEYLKKIPQIDNPNK